MQPPPFPVGKPRVKKTGANDTTSAISNLLNEIVGDQPYEHSEGGGHFGSMLESDRGGALAR